jgi:hypothetical protein
MVFGALVVNMSISTALALRVQQPMIEKVSNAVHALEKNFVPQVEHIREEEAALEEEIEHLDEAVHAAVAKEEENAPEERDSTCDRKQDCIDEGIDAALGSESRFASIRGPSKRQLLMMGPGGRELLAKIEAKCQGKHGTATCRCWGEPCTSSGRGQVTGITQYAERGLRKLFGRGDVGIVSEIKTIRMKDGYIYTGLVSKKDDGKVVITSPNGTQNTVYENDIESETDLMISRSEQCCNGLSCVKKDHMFTSRRGEKMQNTEGLKGEVSGSIFGPDDQRVDGGLKRLRAGFFNEEGVCQKRDYTSPTVGEPDPNARYGP